LPDGAAQPLGPFTEEELKELVKQGAVRDSTQFAAEGDAEWRTLGYSPLWERIRTWQSRFTKERAGLDGEPLHRPDSRRRDYAILAVIGNLTLVVGVPALMAINVISLCFLAAAVVIFNVSLAWLMFVLLKD